MAETAGLLYNGKTYQYPVTTGTENEPAIDISRLRFGGGLSPGDVRPAGALWCGLPAAGCP